MQLLARDHLTVIEIKPAYLRMFKHFLPRRGLSVSSLSVFFQDLANLLESGMSVSQALMILKDAGRENLIAEMVADIEQKLAEGESLSQALAAFKHMPWIVPVALSSGEKAGRLGDSVRMLGGYFANYDQLHHKLRQALIYPFIVFILLVAVMLFVSMRVLPQLRGLLPVEAEHNQMTRCILAFSSLLQQHLGVMIVLGALLAVFINCFRQKYPDQFQLYLYRCPLLGRLLKESALSLYFLNLAVLLKSGVSLIRSIGELQVLDHSLVARHFSLTREYMLGGVSFWQAIEKDKFFPVTVSVTLRRAEEMARLDEYCHSLSELYKRQVNSAMEALIQLVQPVLLAMGAGFLVVIALAFLLPIYGSLTTMAAGQ